MRLRPDYLNAIIDDYAEYASSVGYSGLGTAIDFFFMYCAGGEL